MIQTLKTLLKDGFILVFNKEELDVVRTAEALQKAGFSQMEVTCRVSHPLRKIERLKKELPEFKCGAASLVDFDNAGNLYNKNNPDDPLPSVTEVVEAGADFLVSAGKFRDKTYKRYAGQLPIVPGCGSVSEMLEQFELGANFCKLFPAAVLGGAKYVKAVDSAIHKMISIIPTGGTNFSNIPQYIDNGVLILGGSFSAVDKANLQKVVDEQDYGLLAREFKKIKELITDGRNERWPEIKFEEAGVEEISRQTGRLFNLS